MTFERRSAVAAAAVLIASSAAGLAVAAGSGELPVLGRLEPGLYELRSLGSGGRLAPVCLGDRGALVQLQHRQQGCSRELVSQTASSVEVRYNCPAGFGHTAIRVETSRLARIDSQGVDNGVPFGFRAEARRVGPCG